MIGNVEIWSCQNKVFEATREHLMAFKHSELKNYAKSIGVGRGRTKDATVWALIQSGKATICVSLGD